MVKGQKSYTHEEYAEAMRLLNEGIGITTVSRKLNIPKSTLHYWRHKIHKPPSTRWNPEPSKELAYVIGVMLGDGYLHLHTYKYDVELLVRDYGFAEEFSRAIAKVLDKNYKKPCWSKSHNRWRVYYSSKAFHTWFRKQNLETLKPYIEYDKDTVRYFLRGLYDSEGSNYRCIRISLANSDLSLLRYTQYLLKNYFNIKAIGPYINKRAGSIMERNGKEFRRKVDVYVIEISKRRDVQVFLSKIGFSIRERQLGLPRRI